MQRIVLLVLFALFIAAPVSAQEATPLPAATLDLPLIAAPEFEILEVTAEPDSGVTINIEATPAPETAPDSDVRLNVWQIVLGVGGLLITGFAGGGLTFALVLRGVRKDPALLAAIEGLVNSQPVERRALIKTIGEGMKEAGELAVEAADGIPAAAKPPTLSIDATTTH